MGGARFARGGRLFYAPGAHLVDEAGRPYDLRTRGLTRTRAAELAGAAGARICLADCESRLRWAADTQAAWTELAPRTWFAGEEEAAGVAYEVSEWSGAAGPLLLFEELIDTARRK